MMKRKQLIFAWRAASSRLRTNSEVPIPGAFILSRRGFGVAAVRVSRACEREEREEEGGEKSCRGR